MALSSVVIKVKYQETLRRFSAPINEEQHLDLDMERLRMKICALFNFTPDTDFIMTYIDEDNDQVTLADNEDLYDLVRQGLNPVRVFVHLNLGSDQTSGKVTACLTPRGSPSESTHQNIKPLLSEILKSVPEPLCDALSKLSIELASKAATTPILADFINSLSKVGQSCANASPSPSSTSYVSSYELNGTHRNTSARERQGASADEGLKPDGIHISSSEQPAAIRSQVPVPPHAIRGARLKFRSPHHPRLLLRKNKTPNHGYFRRIPMGDGIKDKIIEDPIIQQLNRVSNDFAGSTDSMFHTGVCCDGCGVLPITGPRFKSKVKHNFDLCITCFSRMGNNSDYDRMDFPMLHRHLPTMQVPSMMRTCGAEHLRCLLDSRFIVDVNVMDGTLMVPSTPFTKIWRMQNKGKVPWARGLQLIWIGGDRLEASDSVEIEIPAEGVSVGNEIDIAVDFIAPELPGRYISYWRMSHPSGFKFGQRVWVLIEVDASLEDNSTHDSSPIIKSDLSSPVNSVFPSQESSPIMDLNLPPLDLGSLDGETSRVTELNPRGVIEAEGDLSYAPKTTASPRVDPIFGFSSAKKEGIALMDEHHKRRLELEEMNLPINNDLLVATNGSSSSSVISPFSVVNSEFQVESPISYPDISTLVTTASASASPSVTYPIIDMNMNRESITSPVDAVKDDCKGENEVEETLLMELKEMGFEEVELNKEVLRANEYDLERSVDDLCGFASWDPILDELKEMGFEDKETNKKLLVKNNGSLTRVVIELITGENQA